MTAADLVTAFIQPLLDGPRPLVIGLSGAQGSGKSTLAGIVAENLTRAGFAALSVSLDDFYAPAATRRTLGATVHPLCATRGPPGSHDLPLLCHVLHQVRAGRATMLPRFDKLADDRLPPQHWRPAPPLALLILEGWCVGAPAQDLIDLSNPINDLERMHDSDGRWRIHVNSALAGQYQRVWAQLDRLVFLAAPDWPTVPRWRAEQERHLVQSTGRNGMQPSELERFCSHYERLTRWQMARLPARAHLTLHLDAQRHIQSAAKSLFPLAPNQRSIGRIFEENP